MQERLTMENHRCRIILSAIKKEGKPWTRAVAAIYRTEVVYSHVCGGCKEGAGVLLHFVK